MNNITFSSYCKTKKGSIIKIVRECYLRNDIHCGRKLCEYCKEYFFDNNDNELISIKYLIDNARQSINRLCLKQHYIIPNINVINNQIDILCDENFGNDIIILQTIWKQLKSQKNNLNVYCKLKELFSSRRIYLFNNEFFNPTFRCRQSNESIANYNENLCHLACKWLQNHYGQSINIVYLIDINDIDNNENDKNYKIFNIKNYLENFLNQTNLIDKLNSNNLDNNNTENEDKNFLYDEHLPLYRVLSDIKQGKLFKGTYHSNNYNFLKGSVIILNKNEEIILQIDGRRNINRALNEDIVAVEILPKSEWKSSIKDTILNDDELIDDDDDNEMEQEINDNIENDKEKTIPYGRIVAIIRRKRRNFCGIIREKKSPTSSTNFMAIPVDKRIPFILIETRQYEQIRGKKILIQIDCWPRNSRYPKGHYSRVIGESDDKETETNVLLLEHQIPHMEFSAQVLNCLPIEGEQWKPKPEDLLGRLDYRQECVISVDPPGCTDIDDALHCKQLSDNQLEIGVHIADVTHFIRPDTAIDREAFERGTTVYLADRRIDMVPSLLSSNLCSLISDNDRLSFSCIWIIDFLNGEIKQTKFSKSIIRSRASLTYSEAQSRIDDLNDKSDITKSLRKLNELAKILRKKRIENGALILASANEIRFIEVESETAENELIIMEKKSLETNEMIEEFMLLANISVAKKIYETFPELSLLRRHPTPAQSNFEELIVVGKNRGFNVDVSNGKCLSKSLLQINDKRNEYLNLLFRMLTTRCMSQALYFCSGSTSNDNKNEIFYHYGLATGIYTHFTSPIRRYADIIVHRLLNCSINNEQNVELTKRKVNEICEHINQRNMNARRANRSSNELLSYIYVKNQQNNCCEELGHLFTIKNNALIIFIMHLSFEVIYMLNNDDNKWIIDKDNDLVIYKPKNLQLKRFDPIKVKLSINKQQQQQQSTLSNFKKQIIVKIIDPFIDE